MPARPALGIWGPNAWPWPWLPTRLPRRAPGGSLPKDCLLGEGTSFNTSPKPPEAPENLGLKPCRAPNNLAFTERNLTFDTCNPSGEVALAQTLRLNDNDIGDAGVGLLAEALRENRCLATLSLNRNRTRRQHLIKEGRLGVVSPSNFVRSRIFVGNSGL